VITGSNIGTSKVSYGNGSSGSKVSFVNNSSGTAGSSFGGYGVKKSTQA